MHDLAQSMGEATLFARTGGAPSLAVGMASIFSGAFGETLLAMWYHFAIMFEAIFILTTLDTGTRVGRFMVQELAGHVWAPLGRTSWYPSVIISSLLIVFALSIDDFVVTSYLAKGSDTETVPIKLYSAARGAPRSSAGRLTSTWKASPTPPKMISGSVEASVAYRRGTGGWGSRPGIGLARHRSGSAAGAGGAGEGAHHRPTPGPQGQRHGGEQQHGEPEGEPRHAQGMTRQRTGGERAHQVADVVGRRDPAATGDVGLAVRAHQRQQLQRHQPRGSR